MISRGSAPGASATRRILLGAVIPFALLDLAGCYHLRIDESFWLRPRPGAPADTASLAASLPAGSALTPVSIAASDGIALVGIAATRPDAVATVLFFGGDNFEVAKHGPATLGPLTHAAPVNVVLVDYRGYGASGGRPSLASLKDDARTVYDWVAARRVLAPAGVVVHGHSLGSFVAAWVAAERPVRGLVLQGSGTTPREWVRYFWRPSRLKWWARPAYPFVRVTIDSAVALEDNGARLRQFRGPLLLVAGSADIEADPAMSRALVAASASPDSLKRLVVLSGSGHEDMLSHRDFACAYRRFVRLVSGAAGGAARPRDELCDEGTTRRLDPRQRQ